MNQGPEHHDFLHIDQPAPFVYCAKCLVAYKLLDSGQWQLIPPPTLPDCIPEDESSIGSNFGFAPIAPGA